MFILTINLKPKIKAQKATTRIIMNTTGKSKEGNNAFETDNEPASMPERTIAWLESKKTSASHENFPNIILLRSEIVIPFM